MRDIAFMQAALALARRGLGRTAPNPAVAALVVDERASPPVVLGRGVTAPSGRPHAEAIALEAAGEAARGATLYVTLEPCATRSQGGYGPSCTERILAAGIARVVIGAADPSPFADGAGAARLRAGGVAVEAGVLAAEAGALNAGHILRVQAGRPLMVLKLAQTADGFAGTPEGGPLAITGPESRAQVHRMRSRADALLTGIGTVLADDPQLDCRLPGMAAYSPLCVVLDTQGRMPATARVLLSAARRPVLIATAAPAALLARLGAREGVEVMGVPAGADGHLDLPALAAALGARGLTRVMVEAGPQLANALARADLVDELRLYTGPHSVGEGLPALGPDLALWLGRAHLVQGGTCGADRWQRYAPGPAA